MTDQPSADDGRHRPRPPRIGDSPGPVTTVVVLATAAIAVIVGLVILGSITEPTAGSDEVAGSPATTAPAATIESTTGSEPSTTTAHTTTTTTTPKVSKSDASVVVANASGVGGSATAMVEDLTADGYGTVRVANSTGPRLERSVIYYLDDDPASLALAKLLASQIPTAQTVTIPDPPPLDRPLRGATVVLMLGKDVAGRPLSELDAG